MEEMHRTHKEPAWGWLGLALRAIAALKPYVPPRGVVAGQWRGPAADAGL